MKKKILFRIAAITLGVFAIIGMGKGIMWYNWSHLTTQEKASKITNRMANRLDLTEAQKGKVMALNLKKMETLDAPEIWKNVHRHHEQHRSNPVYEQWKKELKEILTDEQEKKMRL